MSEVIQFPVEIWKKAKSKQDLEAWIKVMSPELQDMLKGDEEPLRYEIDYIDFPKGQVTILLEFSDKVSDSEVIAFIPKFGFLASGNTLEEAKENLRRSMEDDYLRWKKEKESLGQNLLSKLQFLETRVFHLRSNCAGRVGEKRRIETKHVTAHLVSIYFVTQPAFAN